MSTSVRFLAVWNTGHSGNHLFSDVHEFDGRRWRKYQPTRNRDGWWRRVFRSLTNPLRNHPNTAESDDKPMLIASDGNYLIGVGLSDGYVVYDAHGRLLSHNTLPKSEISEREIMTPGSHGVES